jgi:hypothetical protein
MYEEHPEFARRFKALHPDLPAYMRAAITHYCDSLGNDG